MTPGFVSGHPRPLCSSSLTLSAVTRITTRSLFTTLSYGPTTLTNSLAFQTDVRPLPQDVGLVFWPLCGEAEGYSQEGYPRCATAVGYAAEEGKAS